MALKVAETRIAPQGGSSQPEPLAPATVPEGMTTQVLKRGDTLRKVWEEHGKQPSWNAFLSANGHLTGASGRHGGDLVVPGDKVLVPAPSTEAKGWGAKSTPAPTAKTSPAPTAWAAKAPSAAPAAAPPPPAAPPVATTPAPAPAAAPATPATPAPTHGFLGHLKDLGVGMYEEGKGMVTGVVNMAEGAWSLTGGWVTNPEQSRKTVHNLEELGSTVVHHPGAVVKALVEPYKKAWNEGRPMEAIGRGIIGIGSMLVGTKGLDKLAKLGKAGEAAEAASALGKAGEAAEAANVAGKLAKGSEAAEAVQAASKLGKAGEVAEVARGGKVLEGFELAGEGIKPGVPVKVARSSGAMEDGWQVMGHAEDGRVVVSKGNLTKHVAATDVYSLNPDLLPRNLNMLVQRSSGAVEDGWKVVGPGREAGTVELSNGQGLLKTDKVDALLQRNAERLSGKTSPQAEAVSRAALEGPPQAARPVRMPAGQAGQQVEAFARKNVIGPGEKIADGYVDGGGSMRVAADGSVKSGRELLVVDRTRDAALRLHLDYAKSLRGLPEKERLVKLSKYVDQVMGGRNVSETAADAARAGQELLLGDVPKLGGGGVCRHRSLLFKTMADEAGLQTSLVRGTVSVGGDFGRHAWNEVRFSSGERVIVDVMNPQVGHVPVPVSNGGWYHDVFQNPMYPRGAQ